MALVPTLPHPIGPSYCSKSPINGSFFRSQSKETEAADGGHLGGLVS